MPRDMFGDVVNPSIKLGSQKWYTVPLSILAHVVLFAAVIIIPLMAADVLPTPPTMMAFVGAPPPPPPPRPRPRRRRRRRRRSMPQWSNPNAAPVEAPKEIVPEAPTAPGDRRRRARRRRRRHPRRRRRRRRRRPARGASAPAAAPPAPVRVGGNIKTPTKTKRRPARLSADRAVGARAGRRHHRSDHRRRREGQGREGSRGRFRCSTRRRSTR